MMGFVPTPYKLNVNKKLLQSIGLWPHQSGILKYILLFNMLFFTCSQGYLQIGGMIAAWEDKDVFMESIPPVLIDFMVATKIINFIVNSEKMKNLLVLLEEDWKKFKGRKEMELIETWASYGRRLTLSYAACVWGSMTPFMLVPAVPIILESIGGSSGNKTYEKQLMFRVDFLVDAEKYYNSLLVHSYFGTTAYIITIVAIDTIFIAYVIHACGSFAILGYKLEHLTDGFDIDVNVYPRKFEDKNYQDMTECIAQHKYALEYSRLIDEANNISFFLQLGIIMICISFTGFQTVMQVNRLDVSIRYAGFTSAQLFFLFLWSYPAQLLYDQSTLVAEYVHNSGWYRISVRSRKLVCLMIMRSRVPSVLTAGKFYILNLANFSAVVRTSLSYLTVLTSTR